MTESRLPTALWVEACLQPLNGKGIFYYIIQKGNYDSGIVLLKLNGMDGQCALLTQQRDFDSDELVWVSALENKEVEEPKADAYIARAATRDPDLWVVEIEDRDMNNPFE